MNVSQNELQIEEFLRISFHISLELELDLFTFFMEWSGNSVMKITQPCRIVVQKIN